LYCVYDPIDFRYSPVLRPESDLVPLPRPAFFLVQDKTFPFSSGLIIAKSFFFESSLFLCVPQGVVGFYIFFPLVTLLAPSLFFKGSLENCPDRPFLKSFGRLASLKSEAAILPASPPLRSLAELYKFPPFRCVRVKPPQTAFFFPTFATEIFPSGELFLPLI